MKKFGLFAVMILGWAVGNTAQAGELMKAKFEQSFAVGQSWLPAGEYRIRTVDVGGDQPVLMFQGEYGSVLVVANRNRDEARTSTEKAGAVLRMENNKMYLKRLNVAGSDYGYEILGTPAVQAD
ncbi:MAG: hypothetical protein JST93_29840 [Acidobacteria bacterium]|nr:hypothetical protein [Acidobacteriota bacterium]